MTTDPKEIEKAIGKACFSTDKKMIQAITDINKTYISFIDYNVEDRTSIERVEEFGSYWKTHLHNFLNSSMHLYGFESHLVVSNKNTGESLVVSATPENSLIGEAIGNFVSNRFNDLLHSGILRKYVSPSKRVKMVIDLVVDQYSDADLVKGQIHVAEQLAPDMMNVIMNVASKLMQTARYK